MTGINLNVQNSYAALYNSAQLQTDRGSGTRNGVSGEQTTSVVGSGEKLTLSAEAIALSMQTSESTISAEVTPFGGGPGIRPPETSPFGGGPGIRPPETTPLGGGPGIRPPETAPLGGGPGIRPPATP